MPPEHSAPDAPVRLTPQLVVGLIVIAVGVVMTLDNLQVIDASRYLRFWPGALIILGVVKIWHSRDGMGGAFGGFLFVEARVRGHVDTAIAVAGEQLCDGVRR